MFLARDPLRDLLNTVAAQWLRGTFCFTFPSGQCMSEDKNGEWVLLSKLKQLVASAQPTGVKVDGGKESQGPVAGNATAPASAVQKDKEPSKADGIPIAVSPSSSPSQDGKSCTTDEPVPDKQLQPKVDTEPNSLLGNLDPTDPTTFAILRKLAATVDGKESVDCDGDPSTGGSDGKFWYAVNGNVAIPLGGNPATVTLNYQLNKIAQGTSWNERLGNVVYNRHLNLKWNVSNVSKAQGSDNYDVVPHVHILVLRDKLPTDATISPTLAINGSNPPTAVKYVYDALGQGITTPPTVPGMAWCMVKNRLAMPFFHHHYHKMLKCTPTNSFGTDAASSGEAYQPANSWNGSARIPLGFRSVHKVAGDALVNQLWLYVWLDGSTAGTGAWNLRFTYTSELEFDDDTTA